MKRFIGIVLLCGFIAGAMQIDTNTLQIIGVDSSTSDYPRLEAVGDATDITMELRSKGSGNIHIDTGGSVNFHTPADGDPKYTTFRISSVVTNPVNNLFMAGNVASSEPWIGAEGSDTDVSVDVIPKGSGRLTVNSVNVPTISSTDTLTNKTLTAPVISAQTASAASAMKLTSSATLMTTAEVGAFELDTKVLNFTNESTYRGVLPTIYALSLSSTNTLTSSTSEQALFDVSGSGALTLPTGTFFFETSVSLTAMSATSGNLAFDILGAGTATLGSVQYHCVGIDGASGTAATLTGSTMVAAQTPASLVTAGTSTECNFICRGNFRVTAAGTIIPSGTLVTASAAVVAVGSYFQCHSIGRTNFTSIGPWS